MKHIFLFLTAITCSFFAQSQTKLTPEQLWKLKRVTGLGISNDDQFLVYSVTTPSVQDNKSTRKLYMMATSGGESVDIKNTDSVFSDPRISKDGKYMVSSKPVKITNITGAETY